MLRLKLILLPIIVLQAFEATAANQCVNTLKSLPVSVYKLNMVRRHIWFAGLRDSASRRDGSQISVIRGQESSSIRSFNQHNTHIISLGSGADIFRPLHDFPFAEHFHLVDSLAGWGKNPQHILDEINARLKSVAINAKVKLVEKGFTKVTTKGQLDSAEIFWDWFVKHQEVVAKPVVWQLTWHDLILGEQQKFFYLHPANYQVPSNVVSLLSSIKGILTGIIITGAPAPTEETKSLFLKKLSRGGYYFWELFKTRDGEFLSAHEELSFQNMTLDPRYSLIHEYAQELSPDPRYNVITGLVFKKK